MTRRVTGDWLTATPAQTVLHMLGTAGHPAHVVGGCVRNAVLGLPVTDLDVATRAHPRDVLALSDQAGLRAVPTGIDHGTVTLVVDGTPVEVTSWRRDVATDGRRAVVAFADTLAQDAARRDFTLNALYADADGVVSDPLDGWPDLIARRIRFIGDPAARIAEDGLRVLRFFRFTAHYGDPALGIDPDGLAAIAAAPDALTPVSMERITAELLRLLAAADPAPAVAAMAATGVLGRALPGADPRALAPLVYLETQAGVAPSGLRRLAALGPAAQTDALRLGRGQARHLRQVVDAVNALTLAHALAADLGADIALDAILVRAALTEQPLPENWRTEIDLGAQARFPLAAADLVDRHPPGPGLGQALADLRRAWIDSRFTLDRAALLDIDSAAPR